MESVNKITDGGRGGTAGVLLYMYCQAMAVIGSVKSKNYYGACIVKWGCNYSAALQIGVYRGD